MTSTDTVYLLSKDGGGSAAAITASIADLVFRGGTMAAERNGTGRLPIPLRAVLDEAANVCRIGDLPKLYSHLGGRGINPVTILQSYKQGSLVWGGRRHGCALGRLHGQDARRRPGRSRVRGDVAKLVGKHDVREVSTSHGSSGRSTSLSQREKEVMQASKVRQIERGHGLVWASGTPMARVRLMPWYRGPEADTLTTDKTAEEKAITDRAAGAEVIL
ncbi:TraM recognition domain-containing protein [Streptomyces sp. GKU 257-1]|nr:TraM recognition domain-containing protein [Streptomyces sp. GKU 257-1]